ncbi:MAG: hypothetical protein M3O07_00745 [Pseudomonadota bacterium]|nr:hypothetical protein [Pseudomonadota bacterium]
MLVIVTSTHSELAVSDGHPSSVLTDLESFVAQPGVVLGPDEDVGSLRSTDASVAVATVIANDTR